MLLARPALLAPARAFGQQTPAEAFASTQVDVAAIDRDRILAAGFDAYVTKPIDIASLRERVDELLRASQKENAHERRR